MIIRRKIPLIVCIGVLAVMGGTPDEKPGIYRERSGISYIAQLKSISLLIIHGDKDDTVPPWYSQNLVEKLQVAGGPAQIDYCAR